MCVCLYADRCKRSTSCKVTEEEQRAGLTGLECSTVKKSGLHRNLALGDCSSRERRERPLEWATALSRRYSATRWTRSGQRSRRGHTVLCIYYPALSVRDMRENTLMDWDHRVQHVLDYCISKDASFEVDLLNICFSEYRTLVAEHLWCIFL